MNVPVRRVLGPLLTVMLTLVWLCGSMVAVRADSGSDNDQPLTLKVFGNQLLNGVDRPVQLSGVNRSGTEYTCVQGSGIFDGPADEASVRAIADWPLNAVRVPLNEDCWVGINGVPAQYSGAAYQAAIAEYVQTLHRTGLFAELSLTWVAPGQQRATGQLAMPDADHAPDFWRSVATAFRGDPAVFFGIYGEPHDVTWSCWRNGGSACSTGYQAAGMQSLVDAVRSTGAAQPIAVSGIGQGNNLDSWLQYEPRDPRHSLVAEVHVYNSSACKDLACWTGSLLPVAKRVPVVTGELGETDCRGSFVDSYLTFASSNGISYMAWAWDTGKGCSALITSYAGAPTAYGFTYREHLSGIASARAAAQNGGQPGGQALPASQSTVLGGPTGVAAGLAVLLMVVLMVGYLLRRRHRLAVSPSTPPALSEETPESPSGQP